MATKDNARWYQAKCGGYVWQYAGDYFAASLKDAAIRHGTHVLNRDQESGATVVVDVRPCSDKGAGESCEFIVTKTVIAKVKRKGAVT